MHRRKFLLATLATAPLASAAQSSFSQPEPVRKGFKVKAGEGRYHGPIKLKGVNENILDVKVSGKDTNGGLAVFEQTSLSPKRGTPLHVHPNQDELFQVWDGEYAFQVGPDKFSLKKGETIFLPRNVPHAWTQLSDRGKMTVIFQPAGQMEDFFVAVAALTSEPTQEKMAQLFIDHDMKIVGPPLKVD